MFDLKSLVSVQIVNVSGCAFAWKGRNLQLVYLVQTAHDLVLRNTRVLSVCYVECYNVRKGGTL